MMAARRSTPLTGRIISRGRPTEFYAANSAIEQQNISNDDGSQDRTFWDYQNNQSYTYTQHLVPGGALQNQTAHYDDGTAQAINFDYNSTQPWNQDVYNYNNAGALTAHIWVLDNGTQVRIS